MGGICNDVQQERCLYRIDSDADKGKMSLINALDPFLTEGNTYRAALIL